MKYGGFEKLEARFLAHRAKLIAKGRKVHYGVIRGKYPRPLCDKFGGAWREPLLATDSGQVTCKICIHQLRTLGVPIP